MSEHTPQLTSASSRFEGPRPARLQERDDLIAMINYVFRVSVGREPTIGTDWPHVYAPANLANVSVVVERDQNGLDRNAQGKIVASTGVWASDVAIGDARLRVGGINCVGTLPDYRKHGLGAQVMAAAHQTMRDLGCQVGLLSTGIANWYRRMGWEEAGIIRSYRLNRGNIGLLPQLAVGQRCRFANLDTGGEEAQVSIELIAEMVRLYNEQRLGALRTEDSFRQLTTARQVKRVVLAEAEDGLHAYLLLHENGVVEWAGSAPNVAGLLHACFEELDDATLSTSQRSSEGRPFALRNLTLVAPGWGHPLVNLLDRMRIPYHSDYLGMLTIIDPQAILNAYGISSVQVEQVDEEFIVRFEQATLKLDRRLLTKLFFGPERISDFAADIFPLPFWQWGLEKV